MTEITNYIDAEKRDLGRRLFAAILSYRMGLSSIDYTLEKHVPESIDPSWYELAWNLSNQMQMGRVIAPQSGPDTVQ